MSSQTLRVAIVCHGRGEHGEAVLQNAVQAEVELRSIIGRSGQPLVVTNVSCPHNTGGHGQRCRASHPDCDKLGEGVFCPYAFDYPYVLEYDPDWQPPAEIAPEFAALKDLPED